jgi:hypothetical protein
MSKDSRIGRQLSKADQGVVRDEADATVRETARQRAEAELKKVTQAALLAADKAAAEIDAEMAHKTFWQHFKEYVGLT